jgi:hypothetical protein
MVNTGHPSRACKMCAARGVKCDQGKPSCLRCTKAKRVCPGYRDPFEINLRDETEATIRKAKLAELKKKNGRNDARRQREHSNSLSSSSSSSPTSETTVGEKESQLESEVQIKQGKPSPEDPHLVEEPFFPFDSNDKSLTAYEKDPGTLALLTSRGMSTPSIISGYLNYRLEDQATCFFLANFVFRTPQMPKNGVLTFALSLLESPESKNSALPAAFAATAIAAFSGRPNCHSSLTRAHVYYSKALRELKMSLMDKKRATEDSTLAATILLSCYEVRHSNLARLSHFGN